MRVRLPRGMTTYEWLLFLHLVAAFLLVSGLVAYSVLVLEQPGGVSRALGSPALALWNAGGLGTWCSASGWRSMSTATSCGTGGSSRRWCCG